VITTVDYHTGGEPFRIVTGGTPPIDGTTVRERWERASRTDSAADRVRGLLCHEPRGHADMYGCFLVPPDDEGAHLGALFWHRTGFSAACGHGTIALGAWAVQSGAVDADPDGETEVVVDVPSGRVAARVTCRGGDVEAVTFRNVPSYVIARDVPVDCPDVPAGTTVDLASGGAVYAALPTSVFGPGWVVEPGRLDAYIRAGRQIAAHLADRGVYGVIFHNDHRNVTVFGGDSVDRSPCGSGTSARLALLHDAGRLGTGEEYVHESITGSRFVARIVDVTPDGVVTEVGGMAYRTGEHTFTLDPRDPFPRGFSLR